jgi:putative DNA primase/helicase
VSAAEDVAQALGVGKQRKTSSGWDTLCPAHDDRHPSLSICDGDEGRILVKCRVGCDQSRVIEALKDRGLWPNGSANGHAGNNSRPGLTLESFANAKGFEVSFLSQCGVTEEKGGLIFHYLLMNGQRAARQKIRIALTGAKPKPFIWNSAKGRPTVYGLWRLSDACKAGVADLFLVEGESDALTLWLYGFTARGIPGADNCKLLQAPHVAGFRRVFIIRENDGGGEIFEKGCIGRLAEVEFEGSVAVIEMAKAAVKDPNELHIKLLGAVSGFKSEFDALIEQARAVELPRVGLEVFNAADVKERPVQWLWPARIPGAKLTLFVGHPGLGKSFASLYIAAQLTNGNAWADGSPNGIIAKSVIFSAEDSIEDTIVPRLTALGAERGHIILARRVREANESGEITRRAFNIARDLPHLERTLDRNPDTKLVIVDPVSAFMSRVDSHKNSEVRSDILDPLSELAERRGVTVLAVSHLNKSGGGNALERISGSIAFPAAARSVWGFSRDPRDSGRRLMLFGKSNVGPEVSGLAYRIVADQDGRVTIAWEAGEVAQKLDDVLREEQDEQKGDKLGQACELIRNLCASGPAPTVELESRARELGIGEWSLNKARTVLGCQSEREGGLGRKGRWMVKLP